MTKLCSAFFKYENNLKIGWEKYRTVLKCTQMRARVEKKVRRGLEQVMDHTLVNPNQMRHFVIKVQDNSYDDAPLYLMIEDGDFALPLAVQGTNIMADTGTPTEEELQTCNHITLSSQHPWDTHRVRFPQPSRTVQEEVEMLRTIGAVGVERSNDQDIT